MAMSRPKLKPCHRPIMRADGKIWIGSMVHGLATELEDESGLVLALCARMDGTRDREEIIAAVAREQAADTGDAGEVFQFLVDSGWVEDAGAELPGTLSAREAERYSRSAEYLAWIDTTPRSSPYELQARLKASRVAILGTGGTGSAVAASLAASGIGHIHCVDKDTIELSNLSRQFLYREADIGRPKAEVTAARLRALNSDIEATATVAELAGAGDIAEAVAGSDVFVLAADEPAGIFGWANRAALGLGMPWISSLYAGPILQVGTFIPGVTGCFECMMLSDREERRALGLEAISEPPPGYHPVMAPTAQMTGHFAAMEAIYLLLGMRVGTAGRIIHWSFFDYDHHFYVDAARRPDCVECGDPAPR